MRLTRNPDKQTLGEFYIHSGRNRLFKGVTLERWSGIPSGAYWCKKYFSPKMKRMVLLLEDVPGHTFVEIHPGNFFKDSELCILPGDGFTDMNGDGFQDVTNSIFTMDRILEIVPDRVRLMIYDDKTYQT